jgi:IS5 family transposase
MGLTLGVVYKLSLRQTQGLMRSIAGLLDVDITVPDFSTLSRRGNGLMVRAKPRTESQAAIHLTVDSTGLKIFARGNGLRRSIKRRQSGRGGANATLASILSVARLSARI